MRIYINKFCLIFIVLILFAVEKSFSQQTEDLSKVFPEIEGCDRTVRPLTKNDSMIEQSAIYLASSELKTTSASSVRGSVCGTITLRIVPSIRKIKAESYRQHSPLPFYRQTKVNKYVAYNSIPRCGNDVSLGSIEILFDEDKSLIIQAYKNHGEMLSYAEKLNYEKIKQLVNIFVK